MSIWMIEYRFHASFMVSTLCFQKIQFMPSIWLSWYFHLRARKAFLTLFHWEPEGHHRRARMNPRQSKAMASDALRNGLDALPNICTLKAKNKCPFFLWPWCPYVNPVYVPHWKVVVTIGALFEWHWIPPPPQKKKVNISCPFLKVPF